MERIAYILLGLAFLAWLGFVIFGLIAMWPFGIFGFLGLAGFGTMLVKVFRDRLHNREDDYYSKNVEK